MTSIVDGAIGRARMVLAILLCAVIAGTITYVKLPKEADPDIPIPFVVITVPLAGVTPEDAERLLVRPIEQEIQSIEGLKTFNGYGSEGAGTLLLEFEIDVDVDQAVLDVKDKVDLAKRFFPQDAREPVIQEFNASQFPVMVVNLYGEAPVRGLNDIAEDLQDKLERNAGILEARIQGQREDVLEILIDPAKLETYNISYQEIYNVVTANNQLVPAGEIDTGDGSFAVKVPGLIRTARDALSLPIKRTENAVVTLQDVAEIRRTYKDAAGYATFNGKPALLIEVVKRSGANVLDTANFVRDTIAEEQKNWPATVKATVTSDTSEQIGNQLGQLQSSIVTAVLLVMIIVVAALGWRSALLVGISIPASFVMAFLLLGTFGFTINMMVMFGMVIAVGILVDGAIVVTEYADRKMAEGLNRKEAYSMAGKRMFWPVVSSTLTTLAAFVPFLFWNSMPGKFMAYLPLTLICVLTASLIMALIFLPVLGSVMGARPEGTDADLAALAADADPEQATGWLGSYVRLVKSLIARPWMVTGAAIGSVILIFIWFGSTGHRSEFFLDIEPEQAFVFIQAQGALSAEEERDLVKRAEAAVADIDGIESISSRSGSSGGGGVSFDGANDQPIDTIGRLLLDLATADGVHDGRQTLEAVRKRLQEVPGLRFQIQAREQGPPAGKDLQVALLSDNQATLEEATRQLRTYIESRGDLREIDDTRPLPGIEYRIEVDRAEAGKYGLDVAQIGAAVQLVTNGVLVGRYRPDDADDEVDIRVRFPKDDRSASAIDTLRVATVNGNVPLNLFIDRVPAPRVSQIERLDGKRVYYVRGNAVEQGAGASIVQEVRDWIDQAGFGSDVEVRFEGADEDTKEANEFFGGAAMAALFMMAVILLWEFNNFWQVVLTLSAVIISTSGVLVGIQLVLPYMSILMIGTGIVALAGIVVNNNIVLIDTYNRLRKDGRSPEEAAIATAAQRIRPILLTTGTTICGLLPMVFEMSVNFGQGAINFGGSEAEWWVQLATAVVFGLAFSTMMILLVTPVWLLVPHRTGNMIRRISASIRGQRPTDEVRLLANREAANDKTDSDKPDSALPAAE
jgi:multidrug efflux pump